MITLLFNRLITRVASRRPPDFVVGGQDNPYLCRWYLIPRNRVVNIYLHHFLRDDDDRALHDHPWFWCSVLLSGNYIEHTIARGGIHKRRERTAGNIKFSTPWRPHRIELLPLWRVQDDWDDAVDLWLKTPDERAPCWTLFITGPVLRKWGFHCPDKGWVPWQQFTDPTDKGLTGRGCE